MNGIWTAKDAEHHQVSEKLAKWLANYLPKEKPVLDFGCGIGYYVDYLEQNGFDAVGIDGNDDTKIVCKNFIKQDLSKPFDLGKKGSVLSFETMEHIPKQYEDIAVQTLINHCDGVLIMSWASVGQPGIGHVNCKNGADVVDLFSEYGFILSAKHTMDIRLNVDKNCDWFERNLLVFTKDLICTHLQ